MTYRHPRPKRTLIGTVTTTLVAALTTVTVGSAPANAAASYDETVVADRPVAFFDINGRLTRDKGEGGHQIDYVGQPAKTTLPNGASAMSLDGENDYAAIADSDDLSVGNGVLTIEAWLRVEDLNNEELDNGQYVHWLGKGRGDDQEYALRLYNEQTERPNRISAYVFNPSGGEGSGSYFQDDLVPGRWMHVGAVFDGDAGRVTIYRDGDRRDSDSFEGVKPRNGDASLRIGTREMSSYFEGAIGKIAVYDYDASSTFDDHIAVMRR
jgi:hypothetical protein